jgi:chromosome partitioning protein
VSSASRMTSRPHVVVVGNHKGGSGKSTVAMHVIVALLKEGKRVASFDLDSKQQTLTRYIENRRQWSAQTGVALELPDHYAFQEVFTESRTFDADVEAAMFTSALAVVDDRHDFIVIDTPGGDGHLSLLAHGLADTLLTPINDSFIDLDVIAMIDLAAPELAPSRYAQTVATAISGRQSIGGAPMNWFVVRNRMSVLPSRNQRQVSEVLACMAATQGFVTVHGLSERVAFREFFPFGLTAFDPFDEVLLGVKPGMTHVSARAEVRALIEAIGVLVPDSPQQAATPAVDEAPAPAVDEAPAPTVDEASAPVVDEASAPVAAEAAALAADPEPLVLAKTA